MNPPFGKRYGHIPWLKKFFDHGNGIAIVRAYTSSSWWHDYVLYADAILFPRGKTKFIRPDGSMGKQPGHGVALLGIGKRAVHCLAASGNLGWFVPNRPYAHGLGEAVGLSYPEDLHNGGKQ